MVHEIKTRMAEMCPSTSEEPYRLTISVNLVDQIGGIKLGENENVEKEKKKSKAKRKKKTRKMGFYSHDELIKIWHSKKSQVHPNLWSYRLWMTHTNDSLLQVNSRNAHSYPPIILKNHEVHEKGDQTKDIVIFPIEKDFQELPQEVN